MTLELIRPIQPVNIDGEPLEGWAFNETMRGFFPIHAWEHEYGVRALTAVEVVEEQAHAESNGPHYHVSLTRWYRAHGQIKGPIRIASTDAAYVLREFFGGLEGWEEDNHIKGGQARHFWRPVDESKTGMECFCKKHEPRIFEDGGDYVWRPL